MSIKNELTPPPKIGKIGPYTVFITPPATPTSNANGCPKPVQSPVESPKMGLPCSPLSSITRPPPQVQVPPPVQAPPMQIPKPPSSPFGFFWDAVAKVQNAHASLDGHVAYWFGLNQSKYQWALDDYYESKGINKKDTEAKIAKV